MLTQDEYSLYTGEPVSGKYSDEYWKKLVNIALSRLESLLCLPELPWAEKDTPDKFKMLLAEFMSGTFAHSGNQEKVQSKTIRNFSVTFRSNKAANAFQSLYEKYPDIIEEYSGCGDGFIIEKGRPHAECL